MSAWKLRSNEPPLCASANHAPLRKRVHEWNVIGGNGIAITTRSFITYIPQNFHLCNNVVDKPLRIILAVHAYGNFPMNEIRKWESTADSLDAIIISPMGTKTMSETNKFGFNGIECCGDAVANEVDDLDFVINGVVNLFLNQAMSNGLINSNHVHVIATGFSNGGFFTSLMGLSNDRPDWLVGIVPMSGYQYDINSYLNAHQPLPIFMHHGGSDSFVDPNGCCIQTEDSNQRMGRSRTNCYGDMGIKQESCQSVQSVFQLWSHINGCKNIKEEVRDSIKCYDGDDCIKPANLCIWVDSKHEWGEQFPGIEMVEQWMESVLAHAESNNIMLEQRSDTQIGSDTSYALSLAEETHDPTRIGGESTSSHLATELVLLGLIVAAVYMILKQPNSDGTNREMDGEMVPMTRRKENVD